ncbi:hypothetical protein [Cellulomonas sp. NS3]|uniref:hypothetical protein n=1 Tax=Cellulomonas sp. NS3 TaxID=2973977 RepID=UPI002162EB7B|nr:hypothetical protein [Cellulomonas sp. NS3]
MSRLAETLTTGWRRPPTPRAGLAAWRSSRHERVLVDLGATVPGGVLRGALAVLGALVVALSGLADVGTGGLRVPLLAVAVGCVALTVLQPGGIAPAALLVVVAVRLLQEPVAVDLRTCGLVLAVHLLLRTAAPAAQARWGTRVEVALVVAELRGLVVLQLGAQALTLTAAAVLAAGEPASGASWFRLGAVVAALAAVVVLGLGRWRPPGSGAP